MTSRKEFNATVSGLGLGVEFIPLWRTYPYTDCYAIAEGTRVGFCLHESALPGGKIVKLPAFTV